MRFRHKNHNQAGLATDETITKTYQVAATPAELGFPKSGLAFCGFTWSLIRSDVVVSSE
jgi:hypothetical protein